MNMNQTLDPTRTALVVIDVQNDYFPGGLFPNWGARKALRQVLALRDWARSRGLPIFWVRHTSARPGAPFFHPGTPGRELHPALEPRADEPIVDKDRPNSFAGTGLEDELRRRGVDTVVWSGMMAWMCVDTTVRAAKDLGFRNLVAYDATASGWVKGPWGPVAPWTAQRAFISALGFVHAELRPTRDLVRL